MRHVPAEFYDARQRLDRRSRPKGIAFLDDIALMRRRHALIERAVPPHILRTHEMPAIRRPKAPHHLASPRRIAFVPDVDERLHKILYAVHMPPPFELSAIAAL